jgi:predicted transcriptional regulator
MTRLLILMEIMERHPSRIRTIASAMDMTVQGASDHLKVLEDEGHIVRIEGEFRPTTQGVQYIHEHFSTLKEFVEDRGRSLEIVGSCLALAGNRVREGDPVGLVMEGGILRAHSGKQEASRGVARTTGRKGELVLIGELSGVLELEPGNIHLFRVEHQLEGGHGTARKVCLPVEKGRKALARLKPHLVGAAGVSAEALLNRTGRRSDFHLAPAASAMEAAGRGQSVLLFVSAEEAEAVLNALAELNSHAIKKVEYGWV